MDVRHKAAADKLSVQSDSVDTAISLSSSASSYSIITLKDSPREDVVNGHAESVAVAADNGLDSLEKQQQQLNCSENLPSNLLPSSDHALSIVTTQPVVDTSNAGHCDTGLVCSNGVDVSVDRLERKVTLRSKPKLKVTEHVAEVYRYTPSFPCLPAIMESCRSDDVPLSDISFASGEGYVADGGGLTRSESCQSNASSPTASLSNAVDRQRSSHDSDETRLSVTSVSSYGERVLHSEGEPATTVAGDARQLSYSKSSSDGVDSAVVCTYSSQTSRDSTSTVDNHSSCHSASLVVDDQASHPLPLAADEMHSDHWENNEVGQATVTTSVDEGACGESISKDSNDDELSVMSVKVEWDIDSDSETTYKRSEAGVVPIKSGTTFVPLPLPAASSTQSLAEHCRELERPWCAEPRRACCACVSCLIMRRSVSTAGDVVPTISVRLCSSVVDVVCLIRRLVDVCGTWLQVLCDSAYHLERCRHSHADLPSKETALMRSTSEDHAACNVGVVRADGAGGSVDLRRRRISEGLENIHESLLQRLFDVSDIRQCRL